VAESKEPIHWLQLQCQLADGGKGSLTLDPTVPNSTSLATRWQAACRSPRLPWTVP
jgi:hypothetical protein